MGIDNLLERENVLSVNGFPLLFGCGTDGASVDITEQNGMKGKLQAALPWLHWAWCYAHRLELACHDAFSSHLFCDIDEMLLRLTYLYEKSPKSAMIFQTLLVILRRCMNSLKEVTYLYKQKVLQRVVDRYGAYLNHFTEDKSIKSTDRQRLKGYLLKWRQARMIIGSAMYTDALNPAYLLSLTLQDDDINVVQGIRNILKSHTSLKKLTSQSGQ